MCFSLPTPEDPFNERHQKKDSKRQKTKKLVPSQQDGGLSSNGNNTALKNGTLDRNHVNVDHQELKRHDVIFNFKKDKPLFVNEWGVEFWKCYSSSIDILETSGACSTLEQIAWMISTAADTIARNEKEGLFLTSPFLLFLVPSQEKVAKVYAVCKPLKALEIHTVSLHPGASLDHQIHGQVCPCIGTPAKKVLIKKKKSNPMEIL
ncbi:hypothetical protein PVL29_016968 [Vitis rotundifolia]|uniref:Uncharacterized protein n=1 Tax=Vitis rotundifolia TaxID=103349 RepID=A0AA38Z977_VITRO|nr:hypothetical protein PVL29_016968 [Vitis rotundifolia]